MEEIIKSFIRNSIDSSESKEKADCLLKFINNEFDALIIKGKNAKHFNDLDEALARFYKLKECSFAQSLLEQYIAFGNFDIPSENKDIVHRLDRFQSLNDLIIDYLKA